MCGSLQGTAYAEQWIEYHDAQGRGHAEIDCLLLQKGRDVAGKQVGKAYIFELKRTFTTRGLVQLGQLYRPLVRSILPGYEVFCLLVCKNLRPEANDQYLRYSLDGWFRETEERGPELPILTLPVDTLTGCEAAADGQRRRTDEY